MIGRIIFVWVLFPAFIASLPLVFIHSLVSNDAVGVFGIMEGGGSRTVWYVLGVLAVVGVVLMSVPERKSTT